MVKTTAPLISRQILNKEISEGSLKLWHEMRTSTNELDGEKLALMFLQQHESSSCPQTCIVLEGALNVNASNAGPEQDFSLVTWLSSGRKSHSDGMRNGLPVREVPE